MDRLSACFTPRDLLRHTGSQALENVAMPHRSSSCPNKTASRPRTHHLRDSNALKGSTNSDGVQARQSTTGVAADQIIALLEDGGNDQCVSRDGPSPMLVHGLPVRRKWLRNCLRPRWICSLMSSRAASIGSSWNRCSVSSHALICHFLPWLVGRRSICWAISCASCRIDSSSSSLILGHVTGRRACGATLKGVP